MLAAQRAYVHVAALKGGVDGPEVPIDRDLKISCIDASRRQLQSAQEIDNLPR